MSITIESLNLVGFNKNHHVSSKYIFSQSKGIYPLKKDYADCLLPVHHAWSLKANDEMEKLKSSLVAYEKQEKDLNDHFIRYTNYGTAIPKKTYSNSSMSFLIKIFVGEKPARPHECTKRVLLAARAEEFVKEENLDRIYIPKKFIIPIDKSCQSDKITCLTHAVLVEKVKIAANPKEVWNKLSPFDRQRQLAQIAYFIAKIGYQDAHKENIVLLEDGRFAIIDFDEPFKSNLPVFEELLTQKNCTGNVDLRLTEIDNAKLGLSMWLKVNLTCNTYDKQSNPELLNKYNGMLEKEIMEIHIHKQCKKIMRRKLFNTKLVSNLTRKNNLEERSFFLQNKTSVAQ